MSPGLWPLLAMAAVAIVYALAVPGAQFVLDDDWLLAPGVPDLATAISPWTSHPRGTFTWRPLAQSVQWTWSWASGGSPESMRALLVAMVTIDAGLIAWLARRRGASSAGAAFLALAWGLHRATPSVACYSSAFFDAAALACALVAIAAAGSARAWALGGCAVAMPAALLCKETAVAVVPIAALAATAVSWRRAAVVAGAGGLGAVAWLAAHRALTGQTGAEAGVDEAAGWTFVHYLGAWLGPSSGGALTHLVGEPGGVEIGAAVFTAWIAFSSWQAGGERGSTWRACLAWALALVPVAVGAPVIGVLPHRYVPLALGMAIPFVAGVARGRVAVGILAGAVILQGPLLLREIRAWNGPAERWAIELEREPGNPVTQALAGRWMATRGATERVRAEGRAHLEAAAFSRTERGQQLYDPVSLRMEVAQLAFVAGEYERAHRAIAGHLSGRLDVGQEVSPNAWCVLADVEERRGRKVPPNVEALCAGSAAPVVTPPSAPANPSP